MLEKHVRHPRLRFLIEGRGSQFFALPGQSKRCALFYQQLSATLADRVPTAIQRRSDLGLRGKTVPSQATKQLDTFVNPSPERDYLIAFDAPEFTCLCPITGQPDFAHIFIRYVPEQKCVELKSLKLYLWSYRNEGAFHEKVTNTILDDIVTTIAPRFCEIRGEFFVRGGIATTVLARHGDIPTSLQDSIARPPVEIFSHNATRP